MQFDLLAEALIAGVMLGCFYAAVSVGLSEAFGLTVLMAEQNFHEASRIADRGYIIVHGEIAFEGKNLSELTQSELVRNFYLGA